MISMLDMSGYDNTSQAEFSWKENFVLRSRRLVKSPFSKRYRKPSLIQWYQYQEVEKVYFILQSLCMVV